MTDPLQFTLSVLLLLGVPGPTNTVMAMAGAVNRSAVVWRFVLAEVVAYLAIIAIYRLAFVPLIDAYPWIGVDLKLAAVAFLAYAAVRLWRSAVRVEGSAGQVGSRLVFATTFLNPKGLVIAVAILPREHPMLALYLAGLVVLVILTGTAWFAAGRVLGRLAGECVRLLPRAGSLILAGFAGYLAATIG